MITRTLPMADPTCSVEVTMMTRDEYYDNAPRLDWDEEEADKNDAQADLLDYNYGAVLVYTDTCAPVEDVDDLDILINDIFKSEITTSRNRYVNENINRY